LADGIGLGNGDTLGFNLPGIIPQLEPGTKLRIYECGISLEVVEVDGAGGRCRCVVERGGVCEQGKGISVRNGINLPALSERDLRFHIPWTKKYAFDYLALSFASGAEPLLKLKDLLEDSSTRIIAKVETRDAIDHLEEILDNSVMVMIDRGDLVLGKCRERNTEAIVATHLLDSMTEQPRPMVSEVGDVIQSILDGGSVMMLSRETAVGRDPAQCVQTLTNIITRTEAFAEQLASRQIDSGYDEVLKEYLRQLNYLI
jgi:pyruvate kinase